MFPDMITYDYNAITLQNFCNCVSMSFKEDNVCGYWQNSFLLLPYKDIKLLFFFL